jgi:hypothetical protein
MEVGGLATYVEAEIRTQEAHTGLFSSVAGLEDAAGDVGNKGRSVTDAADIEEGAAGAAEEGGDTCLLFAGDILLAESSIHCERYLFPGLLSWNKRFENDL